MFLPQQNINSLPIPVANANGVKAFSEYGISKILETLTLGKNHVILKLYLKKDKRDHGRNQMSLCQEFFGQVKNMSYVSGEKC